MEIIQSMILGIVQGVAEFLPISSSGHLVLIPNIFGWEDQGLAFDVALHWGTLVAVVVYFRKDWVKIFKESYLLKCWLHSPPVSWYGASSGLWSPNASRLQSGSTLTHPCPSQEGNSSSLWSQRIQCLKKDSLFIIIIATIPGVIAGLLLSNYAETVFRNPLIVAGTLSVGAILLFYADKTGAKKADLKIQQEKSHLMNPAAIMTTDNAMCQLM